MNLSNREIDKTRKREISKEKRSKQRFWKFSFLFCFTLLIVTKLYFDLNIFSYNIPIRIKEAQALYLFYSRRPINDVSSFVSAMKIVTLLCFIRISLLLLLWESSFEIFLFISFNSIVRSFVSHIIYTKNRKQSSLGSTSHFPFYNILRSTTTHHQQKNFSSHSLSICLSSL